MDYDGGNRFDPVILDLLRGFSLPFDLDQYGTEAAMLKYGSIPSIKRDVMTKHVHVPEVGAPDLERKNSPIIDDDTEMAEYEDIELETGVCYFNDVAYAIGDYVSSGDELLRCMERGIWVRIGTSQSK